MDYKSICQPALVYLVIALIMLCVGVLIKLSTFNIAETFSQLSSIALCTLLLVGICNSVSPTVSWVFTAIFILLTISTIIGILTRWINTSYA